MELETCPAGSNFCCWISTWSLGGVDKPPPSVSFLHHCPESPTVPCQLQRMGQGAAETLWVALEIVKPCPRTVISKVLSSLRRESSWARRLMMWSSVVTEQVPGFPQCQGFLNSAIWSPERALVFLMPEPHKKPPVWEVAGMAKAHPAIREGPEGWFSGPMFRSSGV